LRRPSRSFLSSSGLAGADDSAGAHLDHAVSKDGRIFTIVCDAERRDCELLPETSKFAAHRRPQVRVQTREGFVEQQQPGMTHQRPGEGHALLLTSRQLVWVTTSESIDPKELQHLADATVVLRSWNALRVEYELEGLMDRQMWPQSQILEDESDSSLVGR
jgi:hypothetical protein